MAGNRTSRRGFLKRAGAAGAGGFDQHVVNLGGGVGKELAAVAGSPGGDVSAHEFAEGIVDQHRGGAFERVFKPFFAFAGDGPQVGLHQMIERVGGGVVAAVDLAAYRAGAGQAAAGMAAVRTAVEKGGGRARAILRNDSRFAGLAGMPEFRAALAAPEP